MVGRPKSIRAPRWPCPCCYERKILPFLKRRAKRREDRLWRREAA